MRRKNSGFTILELLVVVIIIVLLITLLVPSMGNFTALSQRVMCSSNMRQLQTAHSGYAADHGGVMPGAMTGNTSKDWAMYTNRNTEQARLDALQRGVLWPYLQDKHVYQCAAHPFQDYLRHYSVNNYLNGYGWGYPIRDKISEVRQPNNTISFIEEPDPRKDLMGSWVTGMSSPGKWVDPIGIWHQNGADFVFVDGHTEYWKWEDARTILMGYVFYANTPNNPDLLKIKRHLYPGDPDGKEW